MVGTFSDVGNSLKLAFPAKFIEPMVNNETPFRNWLSKSVPPGSTFTQGKIQFGFNLNPPKNVAQIADGGALPTPKDRTDIQGTFLPTIYAGTFQIGWLTKKAFGSNEVAFNNGELVRRTEETISDTAKFMEQSMAGAWKDGSRGTVSADGGGTSFTMALPLGALLVDENMTISVYQTGGTADHDGVKVTAVDKDTYTVTTDHTATATVTAYVYVVPTSGVTLAAAAAAAGNSLTELVDDGTVNDDLHGQSRTTYPKLKATISSAASNRPLTEQLLINMVHKIRHRCGKRPTDGWSNTGQAEKYVEMIAPAVRFMQQGTGITPKVTGYDDGSLTHHFPGGSFTLRTSTDIIPRSLFVINKSSLFHYKAQEMDWWDEGNMLKPLPGSQTYYAAFFAALAGFENIGTDFPMANGVIRNLVDPLCGDVNP
jgi:hypothetical protein